jgi:3-methyladenine DNA glycosylase AlkD
MSLTRARARLRQSASKEHAEILQRFFKTGPGQYGEGDVFIGVRVPDTRKVAREFRDLTTSNIRKLLASKIHEERLLALLILVDRYKKGDDATRSETYAFYLKSTRHIDNWDLVDLSAPQIVGAHLAGRSRRPLYRLAKSRSLWERRISILATYHFIKKGEFEDTLKISEALLRDEHDLIHKAVGWMLREVGKMDLAVEEKFLKKHYKKMPRTMLRYAIEKFPERKRQRYLKGRI